jgi:hypothetical protein
LPLDVNVDSAIIRAVEKRNSRFTAFTRARFEPGRHPVAGKVQNAPTRPY